MVEHAHRARRLPGRDPLRGLPAAPRDLAQHPPAAARPSSSTPACSCGSPTPSTRLATTTGSPTRAGTSGRCSRPCASGATATPPPTGPRSRSSTRLRLVSHLDDGVRRRAATARTPATCTCEPGPGSQGRAPSRPRPDRTWAHCRDRVKTLTAGRRAGGPGGEARGSGGWCRSADRQPSRRCPTRQSSRTPAPSPMGLIRRPTASVHPGSDAHR